MLGSPILYLKGRRRMMFQLSGFYCMLLQVLRTLWDRKLRTLNTRITLRVQVHNNHILSKKIELHNYYPKPKYLTIGSFGPLG